MHAWRNGLTCRTWANSVLEAALVFALLWVLTLRRQLRKERAATAGIVRSLILNMEQADASLR